MDGNVPWFMTQDPPPNYVAGLGRGVQGFTTRSDIGPARNIDTPSGSILGKRDREEFEEDDPSNTGRGNNLEDEALFSSIPYDHDDEDADKVYELIDAKMDSRRKDRREANMRKELEKYRQLRPKIQHTFADLKQELKTVSEDEWMNIPEIGDKRKDKSKFDSFTPMPDSMIERAVQSNQYSNTAVDHHVAGIETQAGTHTTNLLDVGAAKKKRFSMKLQHKEESVTGGQTSINPKGYLTEMKTQSLGIHEADIADIKVARTLLKAGTRANSSNGAVWIAAARVEEHAGKLSQARKLMMKACENAPKFEDVWLEAARLHPTETSKAILSRAVKVLPNSVKIWMRAANLESEQEDKKKVFRRALEFIPNSEELWKAAIELEEPQDALILLGRAVECIPHCVELWLALAHLETYENAKKVLNKAAKSVPTDPAPWIEAAKLDEAKGNLEKPYTIIKHAIKALGKKNVNLSREAWLEEAENTEANGYPVTCQAIIQNTIGIGLEEADKKAKWMDDAEECAERGSIQTARAIYAHALSIFPKKKSIWLANAFLEKSHGTLESLQKLIKEAVENCPTCETLWLMSAKELWLSGDVDGARNILSQAFKKNPNNEQIWLAAVKLESENNQFTRALAILEKARTLAGTQRVWLKSAELERELGNYDEEKRLLIEAVKLFPSFDKLWMMLGQLHQRTDYQAANQVFKEGVKHTPNSVNLWICYSRCEETQSSARARSILERARSKNPNSPKLWIEAIEVEQRVDNLVMAEKLMAKALQDCPHSGLVWAKSISMEPRKKRVGKLLQALNECDSDPHVMMAAANIFWEDRKVDKARNWFDRAVKLDNDLGDAWAAFYKFELQFGDEEKQQDIINRCKEAEPRHGEIWCSVSKAVENAHKSVEEILKLVAEKIN
mmetsp:Transcript_13056/g.22359  ORF Transcript_13056/g.22359 Transcript_13056/m.22359 type:complete len:902 (-) Transcript_13056:18-2723(-)